MTSPAFLALDALAALERERPGERFTTAEVAARAGAKRVAGSWTAPWRDHLYALMIAGLVEDPIGRPHRWRLTRQGRERAA